MNKKLLGIIAMLMVVALALTACGGSSAPASSAAPAASSEAPASSAAPAPAPSAPAAGSVSMVMGTGGTTGTYYAYGGVLANILNGKMSSAQINVQSTGASKANIFLIDDKEADLAIVQNDVMDYAFNGSDLFAEDGAVTSFSSVAGLYAEVCQIVASGDIKSIADLKGKRVSVGDAGSGVEFNARQILEAYDISFDDIEVNNLGFGDSADAIKDGKIDAFFCTAGAPTTAIVELATTKAINLLEVDDEHAAKLIESYPFYTNL